MINVIKKTLSVSFLVILTSCSSAPKPQQGDAVIEQASLVVNPEPAKGRVDVYDSMARGVKYNIHATLPDLKKKVFYDSNVNPRNVISGILQMKSMSQNPLYDSLRALDYAIIYATVNLSGDEKFVSEYLQVKAAQTLALASIKSHKDAQFGIQKAREIDRLVKKEQREVENLKKKEERIGVLDSEDEAYKKGLEVILYKLAELHKRLDEDIILYRQVTKIDNDKLELEGRRFYELDDLDAKLKVSDFQASAFNNRPEFKLQKELNKTYAYEQIKQMLRHEYPQVERLEINGYNAEDPVYLKELQQRAEFLSNYLVDKVWQYKQAPNTGSKQQLRREAFEEMAMAVMTQNEIAYNVVKRADIDHEEINKRISDLKKVISQNERRYRPGVNQKIDLLEQKVSLLNLELQASQILAERAVAIRAIYFYAGFNPFNAKLSDGKIKDISSSLKVGFNKDVIEMLAKAPVTQTPQKTEPNDWAKKENWLEILVEGQGNTKGESASANRYIGNFDPYEGAEYNKRKILQLGSYREKANADLDWKMLKELYPELRQYSPVVEKAQIDNSPMFRLIIRQDNGGLMTLCNKLRQNKVGCLLR